MPQNRMNMLSVYRFGQWLAGRVPLRTAYRLADFLSRMKYYSAPAERRAMLQNFKYIAVGKNPDPRAAAAVYRNFLYYLVDFLRFHLMDLETVRRRVDIRGLEHMDAALARGNGVIGLTAHIGNWEMTAQILGLLGYPMNAVALPHRNPAVNDFFDRQRRSAGVKVIPLGVAIRQCFGALKRNEIVGILGDRDFTGTREDLRVPFLGRTMVVPRGPAVLCLRTNAAIVPGFVIRQEQDPTRFVYTLEPPIIPLRTNDEDADVRRVSIQYAAVIERYVSRYPSQWFLFREFWKNEQGRDETERV